MDSNLVGTDLEHFRVVAQVGTGELSDVYKAIDKECEAVRSLKVLLAELAKDDAFMNRLRDEVVVLEQLQHPNLVALYETFLDRADPFLVMEYVEGRSLEDHFRRDGAFDVDDALSVFEQMLEALAYLHEQNVVHGDLKPGNVLLSDEGTVKITDAGLAKPEGDEVSTITLDAIGTLHYMAPEQVLSMARVDHRSDLYAAAMIFYEMLAGRTPFEDDGPAYVVMRAIAESNFAPPTAYRPDLPEGLSAIVMRALAKDPTDRYQSAAEVLEALEAFERGEIDLLVPTAPEAAGEPVEEEHDAGGAATADEQGPDVISFTEEPSEAAAAPPQPEDALEREGPEEPDDGAPPADEVEEEAPSQTEASASLPASRRTSRARERRRRSERRRPRRQGVTSYIVVGGIIIIIAAGAWLLATLTGGSTSSPDEAASPAETSLAEKTLVPGGFVQRSASGTGASTLQVRVVPYGEVTVGGTTYTYEEGAAPIDVSVRPGTQTVTVAHPIHGTREVSVEVEAREQVAMTYYFEGVVYVQASNEDGAPLEAEVYVDNQRTERTTPTSYTLPPGEHRVEVFAEDYRITGGTTVVTVPEPPSNALLDQPAADTLRFTLRSVE